MTTTKRVLYIEYIEDNPNNMMLIGRILESEGHKMLMAETGHKGLEVAEQEKPDLIFVDLMLPDIPGFDVIRQIKANPDLSTTPIVVITAHGSPEIERESKQVGSDMFLNKPASVQSIRNVIDKFLNDEIK